MREVILLTKVLLKTSMQSVVDGKMKKAGMIALYVLLGICFLPMLYMLFELFSNLFESMAFLHQQNAVIAMGFYLSSLITFFFSLFMIAGVYYFSKDVNTLLYLPIKPQSILASKFLVMLLYEYIFTLFVLAPMYVAWVMYEGISVMFVVVAIIAFLLIPVVPLLYSSVLTMLLMRFVPFAKNKERFNMIFGTIGILLILVLVYYFQYQSMESIMTDTNFLIDLLIGEESLVSVFSMVFPTVPMITNALVDSDLVQLLLFIICVVGLAALFLVLGHRMYIKTAVSVSDSSSKKRKLSQKDFRKHTVRKPVFITYLKKELKLLIRNPVYFQNCVLISFLMPILMFVPLLFGSGGENVMELMEEIRKMVHIAFTHPDYTKTAYAFVILAGIGAGFFMSNSNMISATAISREGTNYAFMKYIPVPYMTQISAKAASGIIISLLGGFLLLIPVIVVLGLPILANLIIIFTFILGDIYGNYLGVLVDLLHPKLIWEQEASAVKQNFTAAIVMLGGFALSGVVVFFAMQIGIDYIFEYTIGLLALLIVTSPILYMLVKKQANRLFAKL